jgi:hypothetical protein
MQQHVYRNIAPDEMDNLLSQFLISSWSYSKVTSFARNEKAFEMQYIFGLYGKSSSTTMAGNAYHAALQTFFQQKKEGKEITMVDLETIAFDFINEQPSNFWKLQKTTPSVEECQKKAYTVATALLRNFLSELTVYTEEMEEILFVELFFSAKLNASLTELKVI